MCVCVNVSVLVGVCVCVCVCGEERLCGVVTLKSPKKLMQNQAKSLTFSLTLKQNSKLTVLLHLFSEKSPRINNSQNNTVIMPIKAKFSKIRSQINKSN